MLEVFLNRDISQGYAFWLYTFIICWVSLVGLILVDHAGAFQTQKWYHLILPYQAFNLHFPAAVFPDWLLGTSSWAKKAPKFPCWEVVVYYYNNNNNNNFLWSWNNELTYRGVEIFAYGKRGILNHAR